MPEAPPLRDVVLLGGGHANVQVLRRFGMRPEPGLRLTIVAREPHSPYSGMLPGHVAGRYGWADIHIDLARLALFAGARLIAAEATGLDLAARRILFDDRPPLGYDVLSINVGGRPGDSFASNFVTPVKPIGRFLPAWQRLLEGQRCRSEADAPWRLALVGGGPGGVELALAVAARHGAAHAQGASAGPGVACTLLEAGGELLPGFSRGARRRALRELAAQGVAVVTGFNVVAAADGKVAAADGRQLAADHVLWVTGVEAPNWPAAAGLDTDRRGFIAVGRTLQSTSHAGVFAAGDAATVVDAAEAGRPLEKSGVYAVRQGPVLAENLRRFALGGRLRRYRPQRRALSIVGFGAPGRERALASRGPLHASGAWVWRWKYWLDRRFVAKFNDLPAMSEPAPALAASLAQEAPPAMRCGGCGAKLGADLLRRVLERLAVDTSNRTLRGIGDDAALVQTSAGPLAMTCDGFRAMIDDAYRFGRIAAHHALNDLYAMGAQPGFALALATVPLMAERLMEEDLFQVMAGALSVFRTEGVDLVGGHSAEGAELGIAFSVTGGVDGHAVGKDGLRPGQRLVLTKPLGTGVLLAAAMQGRTSAARLLAAIETMDTSNADAAAVLRAHGATGGTDVTGFGLFGHLSEMTRASGAGARVEAARVPRLAGAVELLGEGVESSLQANNERALADFALVGGAPSSAELRLLADPQTAGGLLFGVPAENAEACVRALRAAGYGAAATIGEVTEGGLEVIL